MNKPQLILNRNIEEASENDVRKIEKNIKHMNRGKLSEVWEMVDALFRMIKDPKAAWSSKAIAIGTLIYVISPLDAMPDFIPVAGLADDASLVMYAFKKLADDLLIYMDQSAKKTAESQRETALELEMIRIEHTEKMMREKHKNNKILVGMLSFSILCLALVLFFKL